MKGARVRVCNSRGRPLLGGKSRGWGCVVEAGGLCCGEGAKKKECI